jgi:hypothetical protein
MKALYRQIEAAGEVLIGGRKGRWLVRPVSMDLTIWVSIPISGLPQRTSYADFEATGVTARFDGTMYGRMYSGPV